MRNRRLFASLMILTATLMWGLSYALQSMSADHLGSYTIVFFKGIGGIFLLLLILLRRQRSKTQEIKAGLAIGLIAFLGCLLQQKGIELSTVSKASFITALYIVFVPLLEMRSGKTIGARLLLAVGIALTGLYFLCVTESISLNLGDLLLLLGSFCFAVQIILTDRSLDSCDPLCLTMVSQLVISLLSGTLALVLEKPKAADLSQVILPILFLVFVSGALAQTIQNTFQKDTGASLASLLMSFESVFGALSGWLLLGQTLSLREGFGCLLVFLAILLAE